MANPCWALARLSSECISSIKILMHIIQGVSKDHNGENNFLFIFFEKKEHRHDTRSLVIGTVFEIIFGQDGHQTKRNMRAMSHG